MLKNILSFLTGFADKFGGLSVIVCAALSTATFLTYALLAIFKRGFDGKKRGNFYAICALLAGFVGALYGLNGIRGELFFSSAFLYLFYSLVLFLLPVRKDKRAAKATKEQRELARFIDEKVREASGLSRTHGDFGNAEVKPAFRYEAAETKRNEGSSYVGSTGWSGSSGSAGVSGSAVSARPVREPRESRDIRDMRETRDVRNFRSEQPIREIREEKPAPFEYYEESSSPSARVSDDLPLAEIPSAGETERPCGTGGRAETFSENGYSGNYGSGAEGGYSESRYSGVGRSGGSGNADGARNSNGAGELDYSHVKNVIARLDYFGLKESDRRQIHDLEANLSEAERGGNSPDLKDRINDGLSSLLKIMSKYGA